MKRKSIPLVLLLLMSVLSMYIYRNSTRIELFLYQIRYMDKVPEYSWGQVEVHQSNNKYVVLSINNTGKVINAAEFSTERELIGTSNLEVCKLESTDSYLNKSWSEVQHALGEFHADAGNGFEFPSYLSDDGYLISFSVEDGSVIAIQKYDLFTGELVEKRQVNQ